MTLATWGNSRKALVPKVPLFLNFRASPMKTETTRNTMAYRIFRVHGFMTLNSFKTDQSSTGGPILIIIEI